MFDDNDNKKNRKYLPMGVALGTSVGAGLSVLYGIAILPIGVSIGLTLGLICYYKQCKK